MSGVRTGTPNVVFEEQPSQALDENPEAGAPPMQPAVELDELVHSGSAPIMGAPGQYSFDEGTQSYFHAAPSAGAPIGNGARSHPPAPASGAVNPFAVQVPIAAGSVAAQYYTAAVQYYAPIAPLAMAPMAPFAMAPPAMHPLVQPMEAAPAKQQPQGHYLSEPHHALAGGAVGGCASQTTVPVPPCASSHVQMLDHSVTPSSPPVLAHLGTSPNGKQGICWGSLLMQSSHQCERFFIPGTNHFKNKFCGRCRTSCRVPISRLRAITPEIAAAMSITTKMCAGFWKESPPSIGGPRFRMLNNTMMCTGPWIACFEGLPANLNYAEFPSQWVSEAGYVSFRVAKGTLVPVHETMKISRWGVTGRNKRGALSPEDETGAAEGAAEVAAEGAADGDADGSYCSHLPNSSASLSSAHVDSSLPGNEGQNPAAIAGTSTNPGVTPGVCTAAEDDFVKRYIDAHRRMSSLVEERLLSCGGMLAEDERNQLTTQLQLSRAVTMAALTHELTRWE